MGGTTASALQTLLDLLSSSPGYFAALRAEITSVLKSDNDWANPDSLKKLPLTESAIRESMRLNPVLMHGILREVIPKEGLTLPEGTHLSKGTWIGTPFMGVHEDERVYSKPEIYDPYRFMGSLDQEGGQRRGRLELSQVTDIYFPFSYGSHVWYAFLIF